MIVVRVEAQGEPQETPTFKPPRTFKTDALPASHGLVEAAERS